MPISIRIIRVGVVFREPPEHKTSATGEVPARLALRGGDEANTSDGDPMDERFQASQILNQEMPASQWG